MSNKKTVSRAKPASKDASKEKSRKNCMFFENVPELDHQEFKGACARQNMTMRDAFIQLIRFYVERTNQGRTLRGQ